MNVILGFILLLLIAFVGSRITILQRSFSIGFQYLFLGGAEFLFVGLILGPWFSNVITTDALLKLTPILSLGLGWIGLVIGIQFDNRFLKNISFSTWCMGSIISLITFLVIFVSLIPLTFSMFFTEDSDHVLYYGLMAFCFALAWIGTVSTSSALAVIQRDSNARGGNTHLLQLLTEICTPIAIIFMGVWYACFHVTKMWSMPADDQGAVEILPGSLFYQIPLLVPIEVEPVMQGVWWLIISIFLGVSLGIMFHYLLNEKLTQQPLLLITSGTVILSSGLAAYLHLSPLFVNFILGVTYANLPNFQQNRVTKLLFSTEHPLYVVFLILVGAQWPPITIKMLLFTAFFYLIRLFGLALGAFLGRFAIFPPSNRPAKMLGLGMLPQSGVAIALVIDFTQVYPGELAKMALGITILSMLLNQMTGPTLLYNVLRKLGEIHPDSQRHTNANQAIHSTEDRPV